MKSATYTITNKMGIHARPAADIAKLVGKHKSDVTIATATKKANRINVDNIRSQKRNRSNTDRFRRG